MSLAFFVDKNVILRWNTTGITVAGTTDVVGNGSNQLYNPWGLALTYENTLYVADRYNHRVQKFIRGSLNGTTVAGQANSTTCSSYQCLWNPSFIVLDDNENLFISDSHNHRVVLWKKDATIGELVAGTGTTFLFLMHKFIQYLYVFGKGMELAVISFAFHITSFVINKVVHSMCVIMEMIG